MTELQLSNLMLALEERARIAALSNRQLVNEVLHSTHEGALVEEMMTRLDPEWSTRDVEGLAA